MNHYKKSITFFICFVSLFCAAAHGETRIFNKPYAFSLSPQIGIIYGTSYEMVYQDSLSYEYLSELQWELKPIIFMGLGVSIEPLRTGGFFSNLTLKAGLPITCGTMEDRDWLDWKNPEKLTDFSSHTNKLKAAFLLTLDAGYCFFITDRFTFRPFVSLDYFYFRMEGWDGYCSYERFNWEIKPFSGLVIRYSQQWILFSPGLSMGFLIDRFSVKGAVKFTPFIYCAAEDDHLADPENIVRFNDYLIGKLAIEPALDLSYIINSRMETGFIFSYRFVSGTRGNTFTNISSFSINSAGAGLSFFESSLYMKITL